MLFKQKLVEEDLWENWLLDVVGHQSSPQNHTERKMPIAKIAMPTVCIRSVML